MNQAAYTVLFYLFAASAVILALAVVNSRRLLRAAIYLMGVLILSAGLYVMLDAEFLAGIQVLVYVGGIVVLIVFAVMLTRSAELIEDHPSPLRMFGGAVAAFAFLGVTGGILYTAPFAPASGAPLAGDGTRIIGQGLLGAGAGGYVVAFELISLLLLAAAIGGIVVARKTPPPGQPFTSGGDQPGEADVPMPQRQSGTRVQPSRVPPRPIVDEPREADVPARQRGVLERSGSR